MWDGDDDHNFKVKKLITATNIKEQRFSFDLILDPHVKTLLRFLSLDYKLLF